MKQGLQINQLQSEIEAESAGRADFVTPFEAMQFSWQDIGSASRVPQVVVSSPSMGKHTMSRYARNQAAAHVGIGARVSDHLLDMDPELWVHNMNKLARHESCRGEKLVRTNARGARAMLSPSYAVIDNAPILSTALESLADIGCTDVGSCHLGDTMYLKAMFPSKLADVRPGDAVQAGLMLRNSEIGGGSITVRGFIYRLVCTNGMTVMDQGDQFFKRIHAGRRVDTFLPDGRVDPSFYTPAITATQDSLQQAIAEIGDGGFLATVNRMRKAAESTEIADPESAMKALRRDMGGLNRAMTDDFMERLIRDGDMTQYGLMNAITNAANDADSYEQATQWEELGGRVLTLNSNQWHRIANAA